MFVSRAAANLLSSWWPIAVVLKSLAASWGELGTSEGGLGPFGGGHSGGFGRNQRVIHPTILPELPIQLRDLRNNLKFINTYFLETTCLKQFMYIYIYIPIYYV